MSSDDLLERYLDEVSGTMGRYKMSFRNSKNMLKTLKNSANKERQEGVTKDEIKKIFIDKKRSLEIEKEQLKKGIGNSRDIKNNIKVPEQVDAVCLHYPTGYLDNASTEDLWKQVKDTILQYKTDDIDFPKQLFLKLLYDNSKLKEAIDKTPKGESKIEEIEKYARHLCREFDTSNPKDNETLDNAFESIFHWSFTSPSQLGIGGPNDLAEILLQAVTNQTLNKNKVNFNSYGSGIDKIVIDKSSFKPVYLEIASSGNSETDRRTKFSELMEDHDFKFPEDTKLFYMNHDTWYEDGSRKDNDSYVVYKKDQKALSAKTNGGEFVTWADNTGVYATANDTDYAKLNGAGECNSQTDFEVFMLVKYLEDDGKTYGTDKSEIFEQVLYNAQEKSVPGADCTSENGAFSTSANTIKLHQIIDATNNNLTGTRENSVLKSELTNKSGGGKKKQRGGQIPMFSALRARNISTESVAAGISFTEKSIRFDRELKGETKLENLFKLYKQLEDVKDSDVTAAAGKLFANAPLYYVRKDGNTLNDNGAIPSFEEYRTLITIANLSLNMGDMLKKVLFAVVKDYYIAKENVLKNMASNKSIRRARSVLDNLWEGLIKKYNNLTNAIDNIFGKIPIASPTNKLNVAEIITGIQFEKDGSDGLTDTQFKAAMVNALKNIKEYFPFVFKSGTADIGDLSVQETLKKLTKLFYELPDLYAHISTNLADKAVLNKKSLKDSRQLLTLGGMPFISTHYEELLDFATICGFAVDAAKKSKETYIDQCNLYMDNIESNLTASEKDEIQRSTNIKITNLMKNGLDNLLRSRRIDPDDSERIGQDDLVKKAFYKLSRILITDICKKVERFSESYLRNSNKNIKNVERRIGDLAHSIYNTKGTMRVNSSSYKRLMVDKVRIQYEAKAVLRTLREKYIAGQFPQILLRWTAEKIHNLIFELDMFSSITLSMNASQRQSRLRELGYSSRRNMLSNDSFQKCITRNIIPNNYASLDFWKSKEALFNKLTKEGNTYYRIYVPVLQKIVKTKDTRVVSHISGKDEVKTKKGYLTLAQYSEKQREQLGWSKEGDKFFRNKNVTYRLLLVDIFELAYQLKLKTLDDKQAVSLMELKKQKGLQSNRYETDLKEKEKLLKPDNLTANVIEVTSSNAEFGFQTYKETPDQSIKPIIVVGNDRVLDDIKNGFVLKRPNLIRGDYMVLVTDENNDYLEGTTGSTIRRICYDFLFKLPNDPFTLQGVNRFTTQDVIDRSSRYLTPYIKQKITGWRKDREGTQEKIKQQLNKILGYDAFLIRMLVADTTNIDNSFETEKEINEGKEKEKRIKDVIEFAYKKTMQENKPSVGQIDIGKRIGSIGSAVEIRTNKYNVQNYNAAQKRRFNLTYYEINKELSGELLTTRFTSLSNIQKGFCWVEDIDYVSEIARKTKI
jgi:hypothetical protein